MEWFLNFMVKFQENGRHIDNGKIKEDSGRYNGLLNFLGKTNNILSRFGFNFVEDKKISIQFNLIPATYDIDWVNNFSTFTDKGWSVNGTPWNQKVPCNFSYENDVYFAIVYDNIERKEKFYLNGDEVVSSDIDELHWNNYVSILSNSKIGSMCLGRGIMGGSTWIHYSNLECYTLRIYSKALTRTEIMENYKMSVAYHDFLENNRDSK